MIPDNNLPIYFQDFTATIVDGDVNYITVGLLPSNQSSKRIASFIMQGYVRESKNRKHVITLDFTKVKAAGEVSLEGKIDGILTFGKEVLNASRFMTYDASRLQEYRIMTLTICTDPSQCVKTRFYFNITINDTSCSLAGLTYPTSSISVNDINWNGDSSLDFSMTDNTVNQYTCTYQNQYAGYTSSIIVGPYLSSSNSASNNYLSATITVTSMLPTYEIPANPYDSNGKIISSINISDAGNYEYIYVQWSLTGTENNVAGVQAIGLNVNGTSIGSITLPQYDFTYATYVCGTFSIPSSE